MGKIMKLTGEEMQNAVNVGVLKCEQCRNSMQLLRPPHAQDKSEFYCSSCHISAPLFERN